MEPKPPDPMSGTAVVARVVHDIDASSEVQRDVLLADLMCAAWGTILAQNQ